MCADTGDVELRVDFDRFVCSDAMSYRERTRAGGVSSRRPDGRHYTELVAVVIEARHDDIVDVSVPFELLDENGLMRYEATVRAETEELADERVDLVDRYTPDGDSTRKTSESTTEEFDIDDALDNFRPAGPRVQYSERHTIDNRMPGGDGNAAGSTAPADGDDAVATSPVSEEIPRPDAVCDADDPDGCVVWHRKHLRTDDHLALTRAVAEADAVCPLFVFDPSFYGPDAIACDARVRFLHEALASLDRLYAVAPTDTSRRSATRSRDRLAAATPLDPAATTGDLSVSGTLLAGADSPGLTFGYGDPATLLSRFVDRGWSVATMATPTSRYGQRRDERVRQACGDAVTFVSGDGLVRGEEWPRTDWQDRVEEWLHASQHGPGWDDRAVTRLVVETGAIPAVVDDAFDVTPTKTKVPNGAHRAAATQLRSFVERIPEYPSNISAPQDAREGTSGLSPYLNFGLLSIRQVYQHVTEHAPSCRGLEMFTDRLVWNMHYNQKLVDWPGWTDRAVNPVFEEFNADRHDPDLVSAWKRGVTGFPMIDAAMRCLRETGWLNFRMRAMCASFFAHVLQQPWWLGADWFHRHLVDSDVGINYTQWQSQAGLIGKPSQRVYNPRKQVRDHDPDGEWITEWIPELSGLPTEFLDRPERTPLSVQAECGVRIGEDYPRPVVDFEARREAFWERYERRRPAAAEQLRRPAIAKRASFSGGYDAAAAIASKYGDPDGDGPDAQLSLAEAAAESSADNESVATERTNDAETTPSAPDADSHGESPPADRDAASETGVPTGAGEQRGAPSPDDRAAIGAGQADAMGEGDDAATNESGDAETGNEAATPDEDGPDDEEAPPRDAEQTTIRGFD